MRILVCATLLAVAIVAASAQTIAQQKDNKASRREPSAAEMQEMMKKWMEVASPGPAHRFLDQFAGKWDTVTRVWMSRDAKASEGKGTAETRWVMDGRYLIEEASGQMMGMPHNSLLTIGYDNFKKKYVISYIDNMGTAIYTGEGDLDEATKVMTLYGKMDEPMTGEKDKTVRYVIRVTSKDKYIFEAYDLIGTPHEFKGVEVTYTRRQ
ncbi:MAG TPA: DUF1579 domain-containing protein [Blastocatellia bacterium]|nr:DUF1579 domain-containing protein [Blastocatellia bacterium]